MSKLKNYEADTNFAYYRELVMMYYIAKMGCTFQYAAGVMMVHESVLTASFEADETPNQVFGELLLIQNNLCF